MDGTKKSFAALGISVIFAAVFIGSRYNRTLLSSQIPLKESDNETNWLRDWNNQADIDIALNSTGLGEIGRPANIEEYRMELYNQYGYDAILSDYISVNRSVPDTRPAECKNLTHLSRLPKATVIIIFYNERLSVLLRTVHSVINRTPNALLQEIILVDDCSSWSDLHAPLTDYIRNTFQHLNIVQLLRLPERTGLIAARMKGALAASRSSEVLIFMDSHFEVNYNWLPPLLEPIAINPRACTCPALDYIYFKDFEYKMGSPFRGYFDWTLGYKFFGLHSHEYETPAKNWPDYVLMGAAIAINAEFFWELGGFDDGMVLWGGEQFELSFKIWMCGGEIVHVPCSRMAHLYRNASTNGNFLLYGNYNFVERNFRRLIDVWMDEEHRQYVFINRPSIKNADPGDLTERIALRDRLNCKNFSWMMDNIMPDLKEEFPPIEPKELAKGFLRSVLDPNFCIALNDEKKVILEAYPGDNKVEENKQWTYTFRGEIRIYHNTCLESDLWNKRVNSYECHRLMGNQKWYYDRTKQWIIQEEHNVCMLASIDDQLVKLAPCDTENFAMKWTFTHLNLTEMDNWESRLH